jgi:dienelactone hydrolase
MKQPYIYESTQNQKLADSSKAILIMPDIYGQTDYAKQTTEELAKEFQQPVYMLDYFFQLSGQLTNISGEQAEQAHELMDKYTGDDFVRFFEKAATDIKQANPKIVEFGVVGFCFAGRLAYLTVVDPAVKKIVSFYGAGAHTAGFVDGKTPIEFLLSQAHEGLQVLSFYGSQDGSIPPEDRDKTKSMLGSANVPYQEIVVDAPHAYFQPGRDNYTPPAAEESWAVLRRFML